MFKRLIYAGLEHKLNSIYSRRLASCGTKPEGVFWQNKSSQIARFESLLSLLKKVSPNAMPSLADVGCGYGAMFEFIQKTPRYQKFSYQGVDINQTMIATCKRDFSNQSDLFSVGSCPNHLVDFSLFSGTYNLCYTSNTQLWTDYIFSNLKSCWQRSRYGLIINFLCAPKSHIKNKIFYMHRENFILQSQKLFGPTHAVTTAQVSKDVTFLIARN